MIPTNKLLIWYEVMKGEMCDAERELSRRGVRYWEEEK